MRSALIRLCTVLVCCLPGIASAATTYSIHAEWSRYAPPSGYTLSGFNLYNEGTRACQTQNSAATAMDCTVSINASTAKFTLTAAFSNGTESSHSAPFTFTPPTTPPTDTPPKAVITSSTAAGPAPLAVTFNGSSSTAAANTTISSYSWNFGDGTSATGASRAHTFASAGTYTTTLTVTDSKGLTNSASTPIVVTSSSPTPTNNPPKAVAAATPKSGTAPLTVILDGSASTDTDGTIASYNWTFGDGSSATGKTVTHTYTTASTFTATLQVTDNKGAKSSASTGIAVQPKQQTTELNIEVGEVSVSSNWVRVPLTSTFVNPIVVAGPPRFSNNEPCVVRVRNVDKTGFDIKVAEWNYQDGSHPEETVNYMVLEKGRTTLPNGSKIEAGSFTGTTSFKTLSFSAPFTKTPVIMTTIASFNEADTISGRIKDAGLAGFAYYFREQERNENTHVNETVNFIALEPGSGTIGSIQYEAATTATAVTQAWFAGTFKKSFAQEPLLLADMQTTNNTDTSALRMQQVTATGFQVLVQEERSTDIEIAHAAEQIGYLALNSNAPEKSTTIWPSSATPTTLDAGADGPQELGVKFRSDVNGFITGIRFYKASTNTGTHVGNLWTNSGQLLASATFTNETASGWQQVNFATPVAVTANTVYVASYHLNSGHHSVDRNYFEGKGMDSSPLHALASGVSGVNGVYAYGSSGTFPRDGYMNTNYWVDVVFQP